VSALSVRLRSDRAQAANHQVQSTRLGGTSPAYTGGWTATLTVRFDGCTTVRNASFPDGRLRSREWPSQAGCKRRRYSVKLETRLS
jgi:hypothetical protein